LSWLILLAGLDRFSFRRRQFGWVCKFANPSYLEARPARAGRSRGFQPGEVRYSSRVDVDGFNDPSAGSPHLFRLKGLTWVTPSRACTLFYYQQPL
jgi:hypothetical protein